MIKIRLARGGAKNSAFYRIVAIDKKLKVTGKYLDIIGTYNPIKKDLKFDKEKFKKWVSLGAQVSPTVKKLSEK